MRKTNFNRIKSFFLFLSIIFISCTLQPTKKIVIENENFRYEVDHTGKNLYFITEVFSKK